METIPSPTVINVDFKAEAVDATAPPFPPGVEPTLPVPFRKRPSFLPLRFFSPKRLPPGLPPVAEADEPPDVAATASAGPATADVAREDNDETATPFPEAASLAATKPAQVMAERATEPLPTSAPVETAAEAVPSPALVVAVTPEPAAAADAPVTASEPPASVPEALAPVPAPEELPAPISVAPMPPPLPAPTTPDAGSRTEGRGAVVQLTLSCEVAALRLTPSFQLGAVQLRALSDVVSLRFVAPREAENPLAAAVAFQVVHVELDPASRRLKSLRLKPLNEAREAVIPRSRLQVAAVELVRGDEPHAPISVTSAAQTSTAAQLFGTFHLGSIHFTPGFGVATFRLDLASDTMLVRVAPSPLPTARDLPPSFDLVEAELDPHGRLSGLRLIPGAPARNL